MHGSMNIKCAKYSQFRGTGTQDLGPLFGNVCECLQIILCVIDVMYTNTTSTSVSSYESLYCNYIDISLSIQSTNHLRIVQGRNT